MKSPRFLSLIAALSLLGGLTARADKLDEWYKLLPKNTIGIIAIKNTPELLADWDKSSFAKLQADEEFQKWTAPMRKNGDTPWNKFFQETTGESMEENLKHYPGATMAIFTGDSPEDFSGDQQPVSALSEAAGHEKELEEMKAKEMEAAIKKDEELKQRSLEVSGHTLHILADSEDSEEGWKMAYAMVDGVMVEAPSLKMMEYLITALKSGSGENAEVVTNHLNRLAAITEGNTDVLIYLNGETLIQWGLDAAKKAAEDNPQAQAMPISPDQIISALGIEELQALAFSLDLTDTESRMEMVLLHAEKPSGIVTLLRGTNEEATFPNFIPADVISGGSVRYSVVELWDKLLAIINKAGPMAAMATMQLSGAEAQAGVNLRDDLFASLDDEYVEITDGSIEKQNQVMAIKVKDKARLGGALDGVKRFVGNGFAAFEETDFLGYTINTVKTMNAQPGAAEFAFCLTEDYLIINTGPQTLLKKVLARIKEPTGPSIWENDRVQDLLARLPKGYSGATVSDAGKTMKIVVDALSMLQSQNAFGAKKSKKGKKKKGPKANAEEEEEAKPEDISAWFDPNAAPSDAMWKRYFGTSVGGYYTPADAIYNRTITTPIEAQ